MDRVRKAGFLPFLLVPLLLLAATGTGESGVERGGGAPSPLRILFFASTRGEVAPCG
jgi:hypothetical protein